MSVKADIIKEEGVDSSMLILPLDIDILSPVDDHIFKTLMTHPEAKPVLIDVLSSSMNRRPTFTHRNHPRARNITNWRVPTRLRFAIIRFIPIGKTISQEAQCAPRMGR